METDDKNKFENDLIHQRLTWLGTFEGLLFVANHYADHPYLLPALGLAIALSVDLGIREANRRLGLHVQRTLRSRARNRTGDFLFRPAEHRGTSGRAGAGGRSELR